MSNSIQADRQDHVAILSHRKCFSLNDLPKESADEKDGDEEKKIEFKANRKFSRTRALRLKSWPHTIQIPKADPRIALLRKLSKTSSGPLKPCNRKAKSLMEIPKVSMGDSPAGLGTKSKPRLFKEKRFGQKSSLNQEEFQLLLEKKDSDSWMTDHFKSTMKTQTLKPRVRNRYGSDLTGVGMFLQAKKEAMCPTLSEVREVESNRLVTPSKAEVYKSSRSILKNSRMKAGPVIVFDSQPSSMVFTDGKKVKFS